MKLAKCPACRGYARVADQRCTYPGCDAGYLPACFNCESEAVDALQAPFCSGACREAWEAKDRLARARSEPLIRKAPSRP